MKILALDSSSSTASIAFVLLQDSAREILFRSDVPHRRSDSSAIFEGLRSAVAECGLPQALCAGIGPGSYNGLRAGIAAARALATALNIPLFSLPSPLALSGPASGFWAVGDARGGHYWIASVKDGTFLQPPCLLTPFETVTLAQSNPSFPIYSSSPLPEFDHLILATPDAARLAILSEKADPCPATPEPLYLKPPHITAPRTASPRP
ncbi:MAG: tRNA (adenosine(37)-N6)-threonylcarbamoyltransferase complex dimerization subunit type 1 TsaB [bacterium]